MSDSLIFEKEYGFGRVSIIDEDTEEGMIRTLLLNGARESACYLEKGRHFDLRFAYNLEFSRMLREIDSCRRVLLVGGAGFTFPKYFISRYTTGQIDVIEKHREMYDIAMEYFFLDELYDICHPDRTGRLRIFFEDGAEYINRYSQSVRNPHKSDTDQENRYDVVIDDAFEGRIHDNGMFSEHSVSCISDILRPDGRYMANIISPAEGYGSMQLMMAKSVLRNHFRNVQMWQVNRRRDPKENQNCILYASDPKI